MTWTNAAFVALVALVVGVSGKNRYGDRRLSKNGGIYVDFNEGSGDDSYEDVHNSLDASGDSAGIGILSECHQQQIEARDQHRPMAYVPECTDSGEFSAKQCHMAERQCWCVYTSGREVPGTRRSNSQRLVCQKVYDPNPPQRKSRGRARAKSWPGISTNEPSLKADDVILDESKPKNKQLLSYEDTGEVDIDGPGSSDYDQQSEPKTSGSGDSEGRRMAPISVLSRPGLLAACVGLAVIGLVLTVTIVMFVVYRMRKKDEGSYALDEPKTSPTIGYTKTHDREFFA